MEETKSFIEQATSNSLVIVDELGRGTSTFDGFAIAESVLNHLVKETKCRTLFTTHYHMMIESFMKNKDVSFMKMDCEV
jgi:DNA mismatch repair protein MSH6